MNERIKELAEQAGMDINDDFWWQTTNEQLEKFAELVVRECAKFLDENSGYDECNNAWHPEPEDLLEHFGIK